MMRPLDFDEIQGIRERFATLTRWTRLPIVPDRLDGRRIVEGEGVASILRFADPMVGPGGALGDYACFTPSLRRFAIHPAGGSGPWRTSENTIGVTVNPSGKRDVAFADDCYRYLLGREGGCGFQAPWLDDPVLWPKRLNRPDELEQARSAIGDVRPTETIVIAHDLLGLTAYTARFDPAASWGTLDWRDHDGHSVSLAKVGRLRTWRAFLDGFLTHTVPFMLDADGRRVTGETRGPIRPAPLLIVGVERTGRTDWANGTRSETLIADPGAWDRVLSDLARVPTEELRRAGLAPRTARAMRAGRPPVRRNAELARSLVAKQRRTDAGLQRDRSAICLAPDCDVRLRGRQRSFCTRHASYPGSRRKAWKLEAGR
jgi:hypothetical protein